MIPEKMTAKNLLKLMKGLDPEIQTFLHTSSKITGEKQHLGILDQTSENKKQVKILKSKQQIGKISC